MDASAAPRILPSRRDRFDERRRDAAGAQGRRSAALGDCRPADRRARPRRAGRGYRRRAISTPASPFAAAAPIEKAGQLSLVAGISLFDAIRATTDLAPDAELRLKWPNDILMGTAKMGGILVESTSARGSPGFLAVLGFGLNVASAPDDLGRAATALGSHAQAPRRRLTAEGTCGPMSRFGSIVWNDGENFAAVRQAWMERAGAIGEPITVNIDRGAGSGTYQGLSEDGSVAGRDRRSSSGKSIMAM